MKRIAVVGAGMVTAHGRSKETWSAVCNGRSAIAELPQTCELAADEERIGDAAFECFRECETTIGGYLPRECLSGLVFASRPALAVRDIERSTPPTQFAFVAVHEALLTARLLGEDGTLLPRLAERTGISLGSGIGSSSRVGDLASRLLQIRREPNEETRQKLFRTLLRSHLDSAATALPDASSYLLAKTFQLQGPTNCTINACATGAGNIRHAAMEILLGYVDVMVAGGTEALSAIAMKAFNMYAKSGALSRQNGLGPRASRPFDEARDGFVPAEGAGVVVLMREELASDLQIPPLAYLEGYGASNDAKHLTDPDVHGQSRAMKEAISMAGLTPEDIGAVKAHGTSTKNGDVAELRSIRQVLGERRCPIWAPKSVLGHTVGACGGIETVLAVLALKHQVIPGTINIENPIPDCGEEHLHKEACFPKIPHRTTEANVRHMLLNYFGFGGQNVCLVLGK
ncbi:MAG: beta-ketoacyl-[acyl-carrier-protein] synthase family protein [Parcubacteria group bacterium]|nr:beta-ketoacyl-[acyl-carrier-protein] synthase family protein [Parcubacteria group bacterium]